MTKTAAAEIKRLHAVNRELRAINQQNIERIMDLLRNIAGYDHDSMQRAGAAVLRGAIQEYQSEAMAILDEMAD